MSDKPRRAFTLVELLVVVGILALLLGIWIPWLTRAKDSTKAAVCASNEHQIAQGWASFRGANGGKPALAAGWTYLLMPYVNSKKVLICPSDPSPSHGAIDMASVRVHHWSGTFLYDMPLQADSLTRVLSEEQFQAWKAGGMTSANPPPATYQPGANPSVFYYAFEDLRPDGGDRDFEDVILRVEEQPDGAVTVQQVYNGAGYTFQFMFGDTVAQDQLKSYTGKIPIKGYRSSYGVNTQATAATRRGKAKGILALDYAKTIANCAGSNSIDNWTTWTVDGQLVFARHRNGMNVLYQDGGVQWKSRIEVDPNILDVRNSLWMP